jgi:V-type H+-transporting ATPase subunit H
MSELLNSGDVDAQRYPQALLRVLVNITDVRILQYALTLIEHFLAFDPVNRSSYFYRPNTQSENKVPFFLPFLQLVGTVNSGARINSLDANLYVLERSSAILSHLLSVDAIVDKNATSGFLAWILTFIKSYNSSNLKQLKLCEVALASLNILLKNEDIKEIFLHQEEGLEKLIPLLTAKNTQILYNTVLVFWTISLQSSNLQLLWKSNCLIYIIRLVRLNMPLKILRLSFGILTNLLKITIVTKSASNNAGLIPGTNEHVGLEILQLVQDSHIPDIVQNIITNSTDFKINDVELNDDVLYLSNLLKNSLITSKLHELNQFERYSNEVSRKLFEWNSLHSHSFWMENYKMFEKDDFKVVKEIASLLMDMSVDPTTVAIALFDLGEFAVTHPQGRQIIQKLNIRPAVLSCLSRDEDEVKQQALLAVSKVLVTRWEYVGGNTTA